MCTDLVDFSPKCGLWRFWPRNSVQYMIWWNTFGPIHRSWYSSRSLLSNLGSPKLWHNVAWSQASGWHLRNVGQMSPSLHSVVHQSLDFVVFSLTSLYITIDGLVLFFFQNRTRWKCTMLRTISISQFFYLRSWNFKWRLVRVSYKSMCIFKSVSQRVNDLWSPPQGHHGQNDHFIEIDILLDEAVRDWQLKFFLDL